MNSEKWTVCGKIKEYLRAGVDSGALSAFSISFSASGIIPQFLLFADSGKRECL